MPPPAPQLARAALPVAEVMLLQRSEQFLDPNRLPLTRGELILIDLIQPRRKPPLRRRPVGQTRSLANTPPVLVELSEPRRATGFAEDATRASASAHFEPPFFAAFLAFAWRASPALRARLVRSRAVSFLALALPPSRPSSLIARRSRSSFLLIVASCRFPVSSPVS